MEKITFHIADYVVFGLMLLVSSGIGIFYACAGGKQKSTNEFLMANRSMRSLPVALSVLASFFSASTLLGTPAEIYEYGVQYWISVFGAILAPISGALLFGPMFSKLKLVSVFEASLGIQFYLLMHEHKLVVPEGMYFELSILFSNFRRKTKTD